MQSSKLEFYRNSIDYILSVQNIDGSIPWELEEKLDPWDHIEAAMGLSIAGKKEESEKAFLWLKDNQLTDGSWYAEYLKSIPATKRRETNFSAYIATGLWHYYLIFEDKDFIEHLEKFFKGKKIIDRDRGTNPANGVSLDLSDEGISKPEQRLSASDGESARRGVPADEMKKI